MNEILVLIITAAITMGLTALVMYRHYASEIKKYILLDIKKLPEEQIRDWRKGKCTVSIRFTYPSTIKRHLSLVKESTNDQED